jgi:SAM-dependent methyltransferase
MEAAPASNIENAVAAHHRVAADTWSLGGEAYNEISFAVCDALAHAAQRLNPGRDEDILDVATGTGWTARNVARTGARVTGIDIAADLLSAAQALSAHVQPPITYRQADAENLPFPDGRFDGVISTFGVMFAQDQQRAAGELARVCRKGGRLVLATWAPDGSVREFLGILARYSDAPPPAVSPLAWGNPDHVKRLLGEAFDLKFEHGINHAYYPDPEDFWNRYTAGFGPLRRLVQALESARVESLKRDIAEYNAGYMTETGLHAKREYLLTIGHRR